MIQDLPETVSEVRSFIFPQLDKFKSNCNNNYIEYWIQVIRTNLRGCALISMVTKIKGPGC